MRSLEWRFASTVLALAWTACSSATPIGPGEPGALSTAAASAVVPATTSSARMAAAPPAPRELSASEAWQWLRTKLPEETAELRIDESRANIDKLLSLATADKATLFFDRACRPLALTRGEQTLDGEVHVQTTVSGRTKTVHRDGISFGFDITLVCGSDTIYERGPGGAWVESGGSATGCDQSVGHDISDVRDGQVWYAAEHVTLTIGCGLTAKNEQRCADGTTRTCSRCSAPSIDLTPTRGPKTASPHGTFGGGPVASVDCTQPCPADELSPMIASVSAALSNVAFEQLGHEEHPTLFRDRGACTAYRQKHAIAKDQIDAW